MTELEKIDGECSKYNVDFVYVQDNEEAQEYGVKELPALIYFEDMIPSIYDGDLMNEEEVLEWLVTQKTSDTIEQVSDRVRYSFLKNIRVTAFGIKLVSQVFWHLQNIIFFLVSEAYLKLGYVKLLLD